MAVDRTQDGVHALKTDRYCPDPHVRISLEWRKLFNLLLGNLSLVCRQGSFPSGRNLPTNEKNDRKGTPRNLITAQRRRRRKVAHYKGKEIVKILTTSCDFATGDDLLTGLCADIFFICFCFAVVAVFFRKWRGSTSYTRKLPQTVISGQDNPI